ncbi:hypothetical protein OUZ56_015836 [Daphnia magna]|uniref:Uncharacterized protein n=1 Tax=Daphnia magna TaxID=35525 RepID=A0ABR0ANX7_9CRUS|nr:hypothetical protein OUZ56_015836 [Daphnia magna]
MSLDKIEKEGNFGGRRGHWTTRIAAVATRTSPRTLRRAPPPPKRTTGHCGSQLEQRGSPPSPELPNGTLFYKMSNPLNEKPALLPRGYGVEKSAGEVSFSFPLQGTSAIVCRCRVGQLGQAVPTVPTSTLSGRHLDASNGRSEKVKNAGRLSTVFTKSPCSRLECLTEYCKVGTPCP